jgi:hypothetical protein
MANPYASVPVKNYNLNPPTDGGEETTANEITWAKHKQKIGDPLKSSVNLINERAEAAFSRVSGGITNINDDYTVLSGDQGKLLRVIADGAKVTMISPTTVNAQFRVNIVNESSTDLTILPSSSETIDGESSLVIRPRGGVTMDTDGADWFTDGKNFEDNGSLLSLTVRAPEGYLTLVSGTPVITSDVSDATTVYYTPDRGNDVVISDGLTLRMREITELSLALSANHIANGLYDVFLFEDEDRVVHIGTGPVWNTITPGSSARGSGIGTTELERWKGFFVNKNQITLRNGSTLYEDLNARKAIYIGTLRIDPTAGRISCHRSYGQNRRWGVWNAYNRKRIILKCGDSTGTWDLPDNLTVWRPINNSTGNKVSVVCGLADSVIAEFGQLSRHQHLNIPTATKTTKNGIGFNSTNTPAGSTGIFFSTDTEVVTLMKTLIAGYKSPPAIGASDVYALETQTHLGAEIGADAASFGSESRCLMTVDYYG